MQVVSSSQFTVLSNLHNLEYRKVLQHCDGWLRYVQACNHNQLFVETEKHDIIDILRVDSHRNDIYVVKHMTMGDVRCVAASKLHFDQVAFGTSDGHIKVINSRTGQLLQTLHNPMMAREVLLLDYNAFDERIAAVHNDGRVAVWDTILDCQVQTLDNASSNVVARFHPRLRLHLACGTIHGTVRVYDTLTWQKVFQECYAHSDSVTEIAQCKGEANLFMSSGYDGHVHLYDLRTKALVTKIDCMNSLGTMCMSDCARYFAVGNEMGTVATFDIRKMSNCLCANDVHRGPVRGMFIVPSSTYDQPAETGSTEYPKPCEGPNLLESIFDEYRESDAHDSNDSTDSSESNITLCQHGEDEDTLVNVSSARSDDSDSNDSTVTVVVAPFKFEENATNAADQVQSFDGIAGENQTAPPMEPTGGSSSMQPPSSSPGMPSMTGTIEEATVLFRMIETDMSARMQHLDDQLLNPQAMDPQDTRRMLNEDNYFLRQQLMRIYALASRLHLMATCNTELQAENDRLKRLLRISEGLPADK